MKKLWIGIDPGYRRFDTVSQFQKLSIPSVVGYCQQQEQERNSGVIHYDSDDGCIQISRIVGNIAIKQGISPRVDVFANKNINDGKVQESLLSLTFHAIRAHIPQDEKEYEVNICFAVPHAEYSLRQDNYGEWYSPEEMIFQKSFQGEWHLWNEGGQVCTVYIHNVLVRPQPEMAIRNQILRYDYELQSFLAYDSSWLYDFSGIHSERVNAMTEDEQAEYAVSTVVFDIGSYTTHAERLCVLDGSLQVVSAQYGDIGMWSFLPQIEKIIQKKCNVNHLKPFQLMTIFEKGRYGNILLDSDFRQMLLAQWDKYENLFRATFDNYTELDRVLLVGRGWYKYDEHFEKIWGPIAKQHGFTIHKGNYGHDVAEGAFKTVFAKFKEE